MDISNIRNFCIISHIDAGKSTLADCFLELTKTVSPEKMKPQYLDRMPLERERGITIKLQPVRMEYKIGDNQYILNLIDTPGHVDFSYEVSRSLAAVEGAVLLVDASRGVQAQTLANLDLALKQNLTIIPVINKIDLKGIELEERKKELAELLKINSQEIICVSAKNKIGADLILKKIIEKVPSPKGDPKKPLRAIIFDSIFNEYRGTAIYIRVIDGVLSANQKLIFLRSKTVSDVKEVGIFTPEFKKKDKLSAGEIGYVVTGLKDIKKCRVGDTITNVEQEINPLPGYKEPQLMVFAGFYPKDSSKLTQFFNALEKLKLNDASLDFKMENHSAFGAGAKIGFLGPLHLEVVSERLKREYGLNLMITPPSVAYKIEMKNGTKIIAYSPQEFPSQELINIIEEPWVKLDIISPSSYIGPIMKLVQNYQAKYLGAHYVSNKVILYYEMSLALLLKNFYDKLKSVSSGYASYNYQFLNYQKADLIKLDILVDNKKIPQLSTIVYKIRAYQEGKKIVESLREILPRQQFAIKIQASANGRILAATRISPLRKDVTQKLYGGDITRKKKLLAKQKKGKKKMALTGKVDIPPEAYKVLTR